MHPSFLYFDLGRVLINFDIEKMLNQISDISGVGTERLKEVVFGSGLQLKYETGTIDGQEFYAEFCRATGTNPGFEALRWAASDIFELNYGVLPIAAQLRAAGYRMGILSNTCHVHWEYCRRHYPSVVNLFDVHALSYCLKAVKPDAAIFDSAAKLAGVEANEIFFVDDIPGHVEGAKAAGFDAVQYESPSKLAADLHSRGVLFNY